MFTRTRWPALLCLTLSSVGSAPPAQATETSDTLGTRSRVGLVLSGGGARGLAHIGVLRVLEELRVPVDCITGTSMGALVAGAYAAGLSPQEMQDKVGAIDWDDIFRDDPPRTAKPFRQKRDDFLPYFNLELGTRGLSFLAPPGATSGYKFELFLRELIGPQMGHHAMNFDLLPIPYRAVATDLEYGTEKVFASGDLARAMRASMSVPGIIAPAQVNGRLYVDGGLVNNLPLDAARHLCADVIIAVNLGTPLMSREELQSVFAVSAQSINLLTEINVKGSLATLGNYDVLIAPDLQAIGSGDFARGLEAVPRGEQAARDMAGVLGKLSVSAEEYAAWQRRREARRVAPPPVTGYRFAPTARVSPEVLTPELQLTTGAAFDAAKLHESLVRLYGRGDFESVGYHNEDEAEGRTVVLEPSEKSWGPNYAKFGLALLSDFEETSRVAFAVNHRMTWLNSRGAEWRNAAALGFTERLSSELMQPYSARRGSAFLAARAEYVREPEVFFLEGRRVGEYDVTTVRGHLEVGAQDTQGEVRLGIFAGTLRAEEDFGVITLIPDYDLNQAGYTLRFVYDQLDNADFPNHGLMAAGDLLSTQSGLGSDDEYDRAELRLTWAHTSGRHTLVPGVLWAGSLGSELPGYDLFQLGGLMRLSGYQIEELTGADYALGRLVYYYRYATLPPQVGGGVYLGGSLEAGRIREGLDRSITDSAQSAGSLFLGADTRLGPLWFGAGVAEGGHTAFYFILGRMLPL